MTTTEVPAADQAAAAALTRRLFAARVHQDAAAKHGLPVPGTTAPSA